MISKGQFDSDQIDVQKLDTEFTIIYPEYPEFRKEYRRVTNSYLILTAQIQNHTKVMGNIISYNEKITKYFENVKIRNGK